MNPAGLLQEYLRIDRRPPFDQWFSHRQKALGLPPMETRALWEAVDKEIRSLFRRLILGAPDPKKQLKSMESWTAYEINQILKKGYREMDPPIPEPQDPLFPVANGLPPWLEELWNRRVATSQWTTEQATHFLTNLQTRPPLYIRINRNPEIVIPALEADGFTLTPACEGGWTISGEKSLYLTQPWKDGQLEIQDLASQKAGLLARVRPGMRVWDLCAGEGGKTLLLSGELRGKGGVWGTDIYPKKVDHLKARSRRAGANNLRALVWDGKSFPDTPETHGKDFDVVVVDAPCTASGTWRRDPEAALRLFPEDVKSQVKIQKALIRTAWSRLKPGGRLLYITCSWLVEENEDVFLPVTQDLGAQVESYSIVGSPFEDSNTFWAGLAVKPKK